MTRQERAEQLSNMLKTEDGMQAIIEIYRRVCKPPPPAPDDPGITHALMIDQILEMEFPTSTVVGQSGRAGPQP